MASIGLVTRRARKIAGLASLGMIAACAQVHLVQDPPAIPPAFADSVGNDWNAGRVQAIAISPTNNRRALVAMEFGGLWGTNNGGENWFRIFSLPAVHVGDIEYADDGNTVVATVFRDNQVTNGGGIYVSHDRGGSWARPPTGAVPPVWTFTRTSAYGISRAPDESGRWYVGTDYGVAISADNGNSWTHATLEPTSTRLVHAVLAFPRGQVLALAGDGLYRSDDRGERWRKVLNDSFWFNSGYGYPNYGISKMDRSPYHPWAFILREYHYDSEDTQNRFGTLWFYELDTERQTLLTTPQGLSRGPFVRVSRERGPELGPWPITVWLGHGWDGYRVTRTTVEEFRSLTKADWTSYIAGGGIHADTSDLGVDLVGHPIFLGSDGGIFKPLVPHSPTEGGWVSAAVPGSGMNSLQITDLAGTNMRRNDGALLSTSLYFGTQDNYIWASPDGGNTWPRFDASEGYDVEVRQDARPGEPITVGYVEVGSNWSEQFSDADLVNQRLVPNVDQNGQPMETFVDADGDPIDTMKQAFYLEPTAGGTSSGWLRLRIGGAPTNEVYVSTNSGNTWRKRFDLRFGWGGTVQRTNVGGGPVVAAATSPDVPDFSSGVRGGVMAWVPVYLGIDGIGLVLLSNLYADRVDEIDDSEAIRIPGGSLGRRAAQWDSHTVFGADPYDWRSVIAPDIWAGNVKVTHDGGQSWQIDQRLTAQVLKGGRFKMRDMDDYHMQVTKIAFDPYRRGRILVGTRDAGVVCTIDNGRTWWTITNSDRISYVTGFHFYPSGAVHIASWGHGLWHLNRTSGCSKTDPPFWSDRLPPIVAPEPGAVLARAPAEPPAPRGIADPSIAKLFVTSDQPASGVAGLGPEHVLRVWGRNFPAGQDVTFVIRAMEPVKPITAKRRMFRHSAGVAKDGTLVTTLQLPLDLPHGVHTIEARGGPERKILATADFVKTYAADEGLERDSPRRP